MLKLYSNIQTIFKYCSETKFDRESIFEAVDTKFLPFDPLYGEILQPYFSLMGKKGKLGV